MPAFIDLIGRRYGHLTVVRLSRGTRNGGRVWICKCDCGSEKKFASGEVKRKKSCGHLLGVASGLAQGREIHGKSKTPEYSIWAGMMYRCGHYKGGHKDYAGRGITVCERWRGSFSAFLSDMGPRPSSRHSIERVDNDGDYSRSNCKWALPKEQGNNRRSSKRITYQGKTLTIAEWASVYEMPRGKLWKRIIKDGLTLRQAVTKKNARKILLDVAGRKLSVPECATLIGVTVESAYRLHRLGKLIERASCYHTIQAKRRYFP